MTCLDVRDVTWLSCVSLVDFVKKVSPSRSNVWLAKLSAELVVFCEGVIVALPRPILKVGPLNLCDFGLIKSRATNLGSGFYPAIYSRGWCGLFFTFVYGLCLFYTFACTCSAFR
jgi:hypothetical protein